MLGVKTFNGPHERISFILTIKYEQLGTPRAKNFFHQEKNAFFPYKFERSHVLKIFV